MPRDLMPDDPDVVAAFKAEVETVTAQQYPDAEDFNPDVANYFSFVLTQNGSLTPAAIDKLIETLENENILDRSDLAHSFDGHTEKSIIRTLQKIRLSLMDGSFTTYTQLVKLDIPNEKPYATDTLVIDGRKERFSRDLVYPQIVGEAINERLATGTLDLTGAITSLISEFGLGFAAVVAAFVVNITPDVVQNQVEVLLRQKNPIGNLKTGDAERAGKLISIIKNEVIVHDSFGNPYVRISDIGFEGLIKSAVQNSKLYISDPRLLDTYSTGKIYVGTPRMILSNLSALVYKYANKEFKNPARERFAQEDRFRKRFTNRIITTFTAVQKIKLKDPEAHLEVLNPTEVDKADIISQHFYYLLSLINRDVAQRFTNKAEDPTVRKPGTHTIETDANLYDLQTNDEFWLRLAQMGDFEITDSTQEQ